MFIVNTLAVFFYVITNKMKIFFSKEYNHRYSIKNLVTLLLYPDLIPNCLI